MKKYYKCKKQLVFFSFLIISCNQKEIFPSADIFGQKPHYEREQIARSPSPIVYRYDTKSPEELKKQGGFFSKGDNPSINNHIRNLEQNSAYISTTKDIDVARKFYQIYNLDAYIYTIKNTGNNKIDLGREYSYWNNPYFYDSEVLFKKNIPFENIISYKEVKEVDHFKPYKDSYNKVKNLFRGKNLLRFIKYVR